MSISLKQNDVNLSVCAIDGNDIRDLIVGFNIYEDIYEPTTSGWIEIKEGRGLTDTLPIIGDETIHFVWTTWNNPNLPPHTFDMTFSVYKISGQKFDNNKKSSTYRIHFCSKEMETNLQTRLNNSFGTPSSKWETEKIVSKICQDTLGISATNLNVHTGKKSYCWAAPNFKPFDAIRWLGDNDTAGSTPALSDTNSTFHFFQNRFRYNFVTLNALIENKLYNSQEVVLKELSFTTMYKQNKNITSQEISRNMVLDYNIMKHFDRHEQTMSGMFSSRTLHQNFQSKSFSKTNYDYSSNFQNESHLQSDSAKDSMMNNNIRLIKNKELTRLVPSSLSNGEDVFDKAASKESQMKQYAIHATLTGESAWMIGQQVNAIVPSPRIMNHAHAPFELFSGKFLLSRLVHTVISTGNKFQYVVNADLRRGVLNKI